MSKPFDPYHSWLGIRPEEQPPNHYRLLGIQPFEDNADAIENAADQRMALLRTFQTGKRAEHSQTLLNEVASAKICLLDPEKRASYDGNLRAELAPVPVASDAATNQLESQPSSESQGGSEQLRRGKMPLLFAAGGALLLLLAIIAIVASRKPNKPIAQTPTSPTSDPTETSDSTPVAPSTPDTTASDRTAGVEPEPRRVADGEDPWGGEWGDPEPPPEIPEVGARPVVVAQAPEPASPAPGSDPFSRYEEVRPIPAPGAVPSEPARPPVAPVGPTPDPPSPVARPPQRLPIPPPAVQQKIAAKVHDLFEVANAKTPSQKHTLAHKMLEIAEESRSNPDERFVVLRTAMKMAAGAGNTMLMLETVDRIAADYQLDPLTGKASMLSKSAVTVSDASQIEQLIEASMQVIEQAIAAGRLDVAMEAADAAYTAARRPGGKEFRKETYDRRQQMKEIYDEWRGIQQAETLLRVKPADPQANLTVGRWLCLREGNWPRGLAHLAKGSDPELAAAAQKEGQNPNPTDPKDQLDIADAWWKVAQSRTGAEQLALAEHAATWYAKARSQLAGGLDKARAETRLKEIAKLQQGPTAEPARPPSSSPPLRREPPGPAARKYFSAMSVAKTFGLAPPRWGIVGKENHGRVADWKKPESNPSTLKPYRTAAIEFGLKMKAKWFQSIHIFVDDRRYSYTRGAVLGTLLHDGEKDAPRLGEKVIAPGGWSALSVSLKDDLVTFSYNDEVQWSKRVPATEDGEHKVILGFGSNTEPFKKTIIGIKEVYIKRE